LLYFKWLQKDNPTGKPDAFPELKSGFETSVPNLFCIGDLTGVPLIKLAVESGHKIINEISRTVSNGDEYDIIIVGAGPSGVAASLRAKELGIKHLVLESTRVFNTIENFPTGKPIYVSPPEPPSSSSLKFNDGTKETLLTELKNVIADKELPIHENEMVNRIIKDGSLFSVESSKAIYKAHKVIIAIGKSGNARVAGIPGEKLPKVFTKLVDPGEFNRKDILVVGGGDSAIETANALAKSGNRVTLSYRKESFARPKEQNLETFNTLVKSANIVPIFESSPVEIKEHEVLLKTKEGVKAIPNDLVFSMIGTEIPIAFFRRSSVRMEGDASFIDKIKFAAMLFFSMVLYFGKSAPQKPLTELLTLKWPAAVKGILAFTGLAGMIVLITFLLFYYLVNRDKFLKKAWDRFKYSYFFAIAILTGYLYIAYKLFAIKPIFPSMGHWYTILYTLTIIVFGVHRMVRKPTGYIIKQTLTLSLIQLIPLCLLPLFILPYLGANGYLSEWIMVNVFPNGSYWRSFGFILAWPLFISNVATGQPIMFWLVLSLIQTFLIIPLIVYKWGKGAYCGWICSCGALAETLGDEVRNKAPHGPTAKRLDNIGQFVLWFALTVTLIAIFAGRTHSPITRTVQEIYGILVDIIFAGVLGVGVYFFLSGRVWCRFLCPLAALMHIYARFSIYRIFSEKKRCISCNICTKVCHMGIDVMGYANKGIPMNDVECVRCSACIVNCPMDVLSFGNTKQTTTSRKDKKDA
jgi:thioredoxin reductase/ferredoxin